MLGLDPFFRDFDRLTQQVWGTLGTATRPAAPPMDAWREGDKFIIELDLPGMNPDSLDVNVDHDVLTVRAERPQVGEGRNWLVAERPQGVFSRQIYLGTNLDADDITANYTNGVLQLEIPVAEEVKPRKIAIDSGEKKAINA